VSDLIVRRRRELRNPTCAVSCSFAPATTLILSVRARAQTILTPTAWVLFSSFSSDPATVADNIRFGRPSATRSEVEAAARAVGGDQVIANLPHGSTPRSASTAPCCLRGSAS
jgi:hypothetical protein